MTQTLLLGQSATDCLQRIDTFRDGAVQSLHGHYVELLTLSRAAGPASCSVRWRPIILYLGCYSMFEA